MSVKKKYNRRDFMKTSALAALTLPASRVVGKIGDAEAVESKEYGGFTVKKHTNGNTAYEVDNSVYKRFDARNTAFSRMTNDDAYGKELEGIVRSQEEIVSEGKLGLRQEDFAFASASWTVAEALGSSSGSGEHGLHSGLWSPEPLGLIRSSAGLYGRQWDRGHLSDQEVTDIVKKASLFYGASLVGIAPLDERWIYSYYSDILDINHYGKILLADVKEVTLPKGQVTLAKARKEIAKEMANREAGEAKAVAIRVMKKLPPELKPKDANPAALTLMPSAVFAKLFPMKLGSMGYQVMQHFADELGMNFKIAVPDMSNDTYKPGYLKDGTLRIPRTMNRVIVMAFEMDFDGIMTSLAGASAGAVGNGYSKMAFTSATLAEFIRSLGFNALPCGNNTGLSVPMAIDAGLGELGRHGVLITPKYGPRVRLAKVITDMPLLTDSPISFGATDFCEICGKCAERCPGEAISYGPRVGKGNDRSNNPGVLKWPVKATKCFNVWLANGMLDCGVCIRTCPFNKPDGWLHKVTRILIGAESGSIDKLLLKLDDASGYGEQLDTIEFWKKNNYIHIKT